MLRELYIQKAKNAHSKKNEERASYYMGIVEGIDLSIGHPEKMIAKWDSYVHSEMFSTKGQSNGA